jgi:hypothetical protein
MTKKELIEKVERLQGDINYLYGFISKHLEKDLEHLIKIEYRLKRIENSEESQK